jgi:A/G-specific adenine glycosylase
MAPHPYQHIQTALAQWYRINQRDLPWRNTRDPYKIWVSEVMLQQTQVNTVIPYYHRFIARFPHVHALAASSLQSVLKLWEGLGYYSRARNLHRAAKIIVKKHHGVIPGTAKEIKQLPGVGDYIAAAVLSIAFNLPQPVVDGNVKRVFARLFLMKDPVNHAGSHAVFVKQAEALMDRTMPATYNQAVMELGALVCKPNHPGCPACPLQSHCLAFKETTVGDFPRRKKPKPLPEYALAVGVVKKKDKILITRRQENGLLGGLWEFPGGRIELHEGPDASCLRHLKNDVNITAEIDTFVTRIKHAYTHFKITMDVFTCRFVSGRVRLAGPADFRWIRFDEIKAYPLPKANHKFLPALRKALKP